MEEAGIDRFDKQVEFKDKITDLDLELIPKKKDKVTPLLLLALNLAVIVTLVLAMLAGWMRIFRFGGWGYLIPAILCFFCQLNRLFSDDAEEEDKEKGVFRTNDSSYLILDPADAFNTAAKMIIAERYAQKWGETYSDYSATDAFKIYQAASEYVTCRNPSDPKEYARLIYNLAVCYERGIGCAIDKAAALKWYEWAADNGSDRAEERLSLAGDDLRKAAEERKDAQVDEKPEVLETPEAGDSVSAEPSESPATEDRPSPLMTAGIVLVVVLIAGTGIGIGFLTDRRHKRSEEFYRPSIPRFQMPKIQLPIELDEVEQYNRGIYYQYGKNGYKIDKAEAVKWYRKSAERGYADAQLNLGFCYDNGEGVDENKKEALKWFRKAAEQGNVAAQFNVGLYYANGWGVDEDKAEAVKWYRKAAEQGDADAQLNLGFCHERGEGVAEDKTEAVKWYRKAAEQGYAAAQLNVGLCYDNGWGVDEDKTEAVKWYRKAAEQGYADAQYNLGVCYAKGEGVAENMAEALKWFRKAAAQGSADAKKAIDILTRNSDAEPKFCSECGGRLGSGARFCSHCGARVKSP